MHPSILLSLLSAGALTIALPYDTTTTPTTTIVITSFSNAPAAPTDALNLPKSNFTLSTNTTTTPESDSKLGSHWGWVGSFDNGGCTGSPIGPRPKVNGGCIQFSSKTDFVGISWGSWPIGFEALNVYTDANCNNFAGKTIDKPDFYDAQGADTCIQVSKHGGQWGSVEQA